MKNLATNLIINKMEEEMERVASPNSIEEMEGVAGPNAIERLIDVININPDWTCKKTKLLMYQACHEYQHICDPDPDHTWLANYRHLEERRNGNIRWVYLPLGEMKPSNGSCTTEKSARWGVNRNLLWSIEGYQELDVKVPGFTCPLYMPTTSRRVSPHTSYWLHKKIEEVSNSIEKDLPCKWKIGNRYRTEEFDYPDILPRKSKRLRGITHLTDHEIESAAYDTHLTYTEIAWNRRNNLAT